MDAPNSAVPFRTQRANWSDKYSRVLSPNIPGCENKPGTRAADPIKHPVSSPRIPTPGVISLANKTTDTAVLFQSTERATEMHNRPKVCAQGPKIIIVHLQDSSNNCHQRAQVLSRR
ncbi:hypothetical protein BaRGS_00024867 [Batillaria attramentaria]|uniref:Uncharacterized protein n=1 Tax=Batillaria attramentaria TaxID=370345 RepID=A0ABD0K9Q8_9CAEN